MKRTKLTPPALAMRLGVSPAKVRHWIHTNELRAVNLASSQSSRPRYFIDQADIDAFERARTVVPDGTKEKRTRTVKRRAPNVKEFF